MVTKDGEILPRPLIGQLIEEDCSVGQFEDDCIYILAGADSPLARQAARQTVVPETPDERFFGHYSLEVVQLLELGNHPGLQERVQGHQDNLLLQIGCPSGSGRLFIAARTDAACLEEDLGLVLDSAERIAGHYVRKAVRDFALTSAGEFASLARGAIKDKNFLSAFLAASIDRGMSSFVPLPTGLIPAGTVSGDAAEPDETEGTKGGVSFRRRMEMYERFLDNLKKYHKTRDPRIAAELDFVISIIDPVTLRTLFLKQSPRLQEKINDCINPRRMAETSSMDVEVRKVESIDKTRKNDGHYRLFLVRGYESLMVHFSRKSGFILYLIYLLDRKKNGNRVDTLNVSAYKELFGKLYGMVYGINGESVFADMMKNFNDKNEARQKGLYTVMKSIRDDVGLTCERMREPAEPFLLRDISSHLAVLPGHIIMPEEMMALI